MDDAYEKIAIGEGLGVGSRPGDLPRDAGKRGREVVALFRRAGQLDAERPLGRRRPQLLEDLLSQGDDHVKRPALSGQRFSRSVTAYLARAAPTRRRSAREAFSATLGRSFA